MEWALRQHWHTDEAPVFYTENAPINSLFGLLCWPAMFAPLPGAFFHPFQGAPTDLNAPDFVERMQPFMPDLPCNGYWFGRPGLEQGLQRGPE